MDMNNDMMAPSERRQGMAIASLVLGILAVMCFGPFAAIPAIILGHIAYNRSRTAPGQYSGGGLAIAGFVMGYVGLLATTAVLAGLLLPALAKAKSKAQSIACVNNMKQIGLAFRIFATDHGDRFPFNVATNETGVRIEATGMDEANIFRTMSNELGSPRILVCPADASRQPAQSMANLTAANISYEVEFGPEVKESNPQAVLARCPIHGHELYCDGSVHQTRGR
jgi:hypothetical protein